MADLYHVYTTVNGEPVDTRFEFKKNAIAFARALDFAGCNTTVVNEFGDDEPIYESEDVAYPNGIYLLADTPPTLYPLAVEDGSGDRALLREALAEHNVEAFGASTDYPEVRGYVTDRIAADEEDGGAPVADVIEATAEEFTLGTAIDVSRDLHRTGEVYAPTKTTLRRTDQTES